MSKERTQSIIFTIGHSTHSLDQFITLLQHYGINHVIDIRTIPRSRHNPQFNEQELSKALHDNHIKYTHIKELGGLRRPQKNSKNIGWHNASFRGFADYMQTEEFHQGIQLKFGHK